MEVSEMTTPHWSNRLIRAFPMEQTSTVSVEINPDDTRPAVVVLASRVRGLIDALGPRDVGGRDPLADEDEADLLWLLDHLHRVVYALSSQEDRLLSLLRDKGTSYARIGAALEMSAPGVKRRVDRIERADAQGMHSAAYLDHAED